MNKIVSTHRKPKKITGVLLRGAFVKQGVSSTFATWGSLRYPGPKKLLGTFRFKSKLFSLLVELRADIWVVSGGASKDAFARKILRQHKTTPLADVPWNEYDVVISVLPFIPRRIIEANPRILWGYLSVTHTSKVHNQSVSKPLNGYDLFLDHTRVGEVGRLRLPASVPFPFPTNPDTMRNVVMPTNMPIPSIFVDTRLTKKEPLSWFEKRTSLPVRHSPRPASNGRKVLAGDFSATREYLEAVGACKYFLLARKRNFVGQAALEAAALGLIVVSGPGVIPSVLCHPSCLVEAENMRQGMGAIRKIEKDVGLQQKILRHQDGVLRDVFWDKPFGILEKAWRMKK